MDQEAAQRGGPFRLTPVENARLGGTSLQDHIELVPAKVAAAFGDEYGNDGYKVSRDYAFEGPDGLVFTLYDWKHTTMYDPDHGERPEKFWASTQPYDFHIGGNSADRIEEFKAWLRQTVG